jgi:hypothetical protein
MRMRRIRASTMRALGVRLPVTDAPNATSKALTRQTRAHEIFSVNTIPPAQMRTGKFVFRTGQYQRKLAPREN